MFLFAEPGKSVDYLQEKVGVLHGSTRPIWESSSPFPSLPHKLSASDTLLGFYLRISSSPSTLDFADAIPSTGTPLALLFLLPHCA